MKFSSSPPALPYGVFFNVAFHSAKRYLCHMREHYKQSYLHDAHFFLFCPMSCCVSSRACVYNICVRPFVAPLYPP